MLPWLKQRRDLQRTARELYGSIVTQARLPAFYDHWRVPDTAQGRFEMIALHLALVLRRLGTERLAGERLGRSLAEAWTVDLDDAMREMTFGDLAVPREIKRATAALYDRYRAYDTALEASHNGALELALQSQLSYLAGERSIDIERLSTYMREAADILKEEPSVHVLAGKVRWPTTGFTSDGK